MYDRQCLKTDNKEYLAEIKRLLDNRPDDITSPQLVAAFDQLHEKYIGPLPSFKDVKKKLTDPLQTNAPKPKDFFSSQITAERSFWIS